MAARSTSGNSRRISFAKITEPLEVPQLLSLQTDSFDWLIGNEKWQAAVERRRGEGEDVSSKSGLQEIFEEISPIEDFSETMSLSFENPVFYDPKYTVDECKEKDFTYSAPLYVSAEFTNNDTGEIKGQTVFMGDFPLMTDKGTFIINGTERVVVSQLVRSPGRLLRAHRRQDVRQGHLHREADPEPRRLARVRDRQARPGRRPPRPQAQAERHRAAQGPPGRRRGDRRGLRLRRRHGRAASVRVDPAHRGEGPHPGSRRRAARHLPQAAPGRAADARGRADAAEELLLQPQALRPGQGRSLQDQQEARPARGLRPADADHRRRRRRDQLHRRAARRPRAGRGAAGHPRHLPPTTSTTSATAGCARSAS